MPADNELEQCITDLDGIIKRLDAHGLDLAARLAGAASLALKMHLYKVTTEELELVEFLAELGCTSADAPAEDDDDPTDGHDGA